MTAQIFGREPKWFAMAADVLTQLQLFAGIDINMGCPAHKGTGGQGTGFMPGRRTGK